MNRKHNSPGRDECGSRRLLRLAAVVAVALSVGPVGCGAKADSAVIAPAAGSAGFAPFVFIQAGDPQLGGWGQIDKPRDRLLELARRADELGAAFVLVVGDLVTHADNPAEQQAADQALKEFHVPVRLIVGNHDDLAVFRRKYGPDCYSFTHRNCRFVCINSNLFSPLRPNPAQRARAEAQWKWLEQALQEARRERPAYVFLAMHHPLGTLPRARKRLEGLIQRYGVQVVLAGHVHTTREVHHQGFTEYTVAGTGFAVDGRPLGYRVFRVSPLGVRQEFVPLDQPVKAAPPAAGLPSGARLLVGAPAGGGAP